MSRPYKVTKDAEYWLKGEEVFRNARGQRGPIRSDTGMPANARWTSSKAQFDHFNPPRSRRKEFQGSAS